MKRMATVFLMIIFSLMCSCSSKLVTNKVILSIGEVVSGKFFSDGDFQDYTDYGIYKFKDADLKSNKYLKPMTDAGMKLMISYVDDFERWIEVIASNEPDNELIVNYNFDRACITDSDYVYIDDKCEYDELYKDNRYACYSVYFYDSETDTMYYFHNNI